jgi:hypothetical protein
VPYQKAALARRFALLILSSLLGAGCGRMGFDLPNGGAQPDGTLDGGMLDVPLDVPFDPQTLVGCNQAAPFLHLIDVIVIANPSTQYARYCYAGLPGSLFAYVLYAADEDVFFATSVPIADQVVPLYFGGSGCSACFVRLMANGQVADGPITDFVGD